MRYEFNRIPAIWLMSQYGFRPQNRAMTISHTLQPRRRFRRFLGWVALAVAMMIGVMVPLMIGTASDEPGGNTPDERAISFVAEQLRADGAPDAAFAVVRDGHIIESGALGDEVTVETPLALGSLSKTFTATAVMQLVDQGKVDLDAPVTRYIPWFKTAGEATITVRHLLTQTSGLPTWAGTVDLNSPETTLEERVKAVAEIKPVSAPGKTFHYCNKNYATLGLLVQRVAGTPFAEYLQRHILDPLDMEHTFTDRKQARDAGLVEGSAVWFGAHVPVHSPDFPGALPDGGLISTVGDLSHFIQMQDDGTYAGHRVLSAESLQTMHTGVAKDDYGSRYGLGWRESKTRGQRTIAHEGDLSTAHVNLGAFPQDGTGLVVLTNHNSILFDPSAAYAGGLDILAGDDTPPVGQTYRLVSASMACLAVLVLILLAAGTVGVVRTIRSPADPSTNRRIWWRAVAYLLASAGLATLFQFGLGAAMKENVVFTPAVAFAYLPDLTAIIAATVAWLAVAGLVLLIVGTDRHKRLAASSSVLEQ